MITRDMLERMSEDELHDWLLRRMRGEEMDPPLAPYRFETPDDYIAVVHGQTNDLAFRSRLERVIVHALAQEAEADDLTSGPDAEAVTNLAELSLQRRLVAALPPLRRAAERGRFGAHEGAVHEKTEQSVLFALAGLQERKALWERWEALWARAEPKLWPTVVAGLRISNPYKATKMLPQIVRRALTVDHFPLGEVLWAFGNDPNIDAEQITQALAGLSPRDLDACRSELHEIGASDGQIDAWIPAAPSGAYPAWAVPKPNYPSAPPRMNRTNKPTGKAA